MEKTHKLAFKCKFQVTPIENTKPTVQPQIVTCHSASEPHVPVSTSESNTTEQEDIADTATPESADALPDIVLMPTRHYPERSLNL